MLSTPLICCSIGVATDCSTVKASAPTYVVLTWTSGGVILGNCAVGKLSIATTPTMTITIEITMDTIGRFMKNLYTLFTFGRRCRQCSTLPLPRVPVERVWLELPSPRAPFASLPPQFVHRALGLRRQSTWCQPEAQL